LLRGEHQLMAIPREVPLSEALRATKTHDKMWRDLLEAGFVKRAYRGQGNAYVITAAEYERLKAIAATRKQIEGRFTLGKLAMALAADRQRWVPVTLLQNELQRQVSNFLGLARRTLQRSLGLSPRIGYVTEPQIATASTKLSLRLTKKMPLAKRLVAFSAIYIFSAMILKMMYLRKANPLDYAGTIKQLLIQTGTMEHKDRGHIGFSFDRAAQLANQFASTLTSLWQVLTLDDSINILSTSTHRLNDKDFWRAYDAADLVGRAFFDVYADIRPDLRLPLLTDDVRLKLKPYILATLFAYTANPPRDRALLDELLRGSDETLRAILSQLLVAVRTFLKAQQLLNAEKRESRVK
jgi:hypothetical protein